MNGIYSRIGETRIINVYVQKINKRIYLFDILAPRNFADKCFIMFAGRHLSGYTESCCQFYYLASIFSAANLQ